MPRIIFFIIAIIIIFGLIYFIQFVDFYGILDVFEKKYTIIFYIIPIISSIFFTLITYLSFLISEKLYQIFYIISFSILGIFINFFMFISIYLFIGIFYDWPKKIYGIIICIIIPFLFSCYGFLCPFFTKIEHITLKFKNFKGKKKTICHISDVHLGAIYQKNFSEKIVRLIEKIHFDILVITGDLCDGSLQVKADWMESFNKIDKPILYITGNHEEIHGTYKMLKETEKTKIKHVCNTNILVEDINFVCVDYETDFFETLNKIKPIENNIENNEKNENNENNIENNENINFNNNEIPNVLLAHIPLLKPEELKNYNIFLFLCGHTHGGQFFPFHIPTYFANSCFWGLYKSKNSDNYVFVSQGVGLANVPMRTFSRSVISFITIENEENNENNGNNSENENDGNVYTNLKN
jgi:hypothetical protein